MALWAPLLPMTFALVLISGWALYNRNRDDVRQDWRRISFLVLGHALLIVVIGSVLVFPEYLAVIATGAVALLAVMWAYGSRAP